MTKRRSFEPIIVIPQSSDGRSRQVVLAEVVIVADTAAERNLRF
jgi:hypothetical protein